MASLLAVDPYVTDWLDLLARWLHVIAAIVWIGTSFYFIALDNHLLPPKEEILDVLRERLERTREEELDTALTELVAIAEDRWRRS